MVVNYEQILKANEKIKTIDIKGNQYAEVNQRVKAFRMVYPLGFILTEMRSNVDGVCVFTATVGYYDEHGERCVLATGTAYERESANYINKTSFIEVCESSAVGRALGLAGFGIDTSICSAEEVKNAIEQQARVTPEQIERLKQLVPDIPGMLKYYKVNTIEEMSAEAAAKIIKRKEGQKNG